jgi:hypothetical protein
MESKVNLIDKGADWKAQSQPLGIEKNFNWGLDKHAASMVASMIRENIPDPSDIAYTQIQKLLALAKKRNIQASDINELVRLLLNASELSLAEQSAARASLKRYYTLFNNHELLRRLNTAETKPESPNPFNHFLDTYHIQGTINQAEIPNLIDSITDRVIPLHCQNKLVLNTLPHTPFYYLTQENSLLELVFTEPGMGIQTKIGHEPMVNFPNYFAEGNRDGAFIAFTAWYALLLMSIQEKGKQISFKKSEDSTWLAIDQQLAPSDPFFTGTDLSLVFSSADKIGIDIRIPVEAENQSLYAVFFSRSLGIHIEKTELLSEKEKRLDLSLNFNLSELYNSAAGFRGEITFKEKADFFKLFIVKSDPSAQESIRERIGGLGSPLFYELITTPQHRFFSIHTIGLSLENVQSTTLIPFNNKYVLIVGTGDKRLSEAQHMASQSIARLLAEKGYGIIGGGWQGVDGVVAETFDQVLSSFQMNEDSRYIQLESFNKTSSYSFGTSIKLSREEEWYDAALNRAGAVIIIGGQGGSYQAYIAAAAKKIPVIPFPATGGDARKAYQSITTKKQTYGAKTDFENLDKQILNVEDSVKISQAVIDLIEKTAFSAKPSMTLSEFKKTVRRIYRRQRITNQYDLQKDRWGGAASRNGKTLSASVVPNETKGWYNLRLTITAENHSNLKGHVAFFLHDSFDEEIQYVTATDGLAFTDEETYEIFTAAAYTEDGTMLELDLSKVKGLPKGFYQQQDELPKNKKRK